MGTSNFLGPSYFETALIPISRYAPTHAPWKNRSDLRN